MGLDEMRTLGFMKVSSYTKVVYNYHKIQIMYVKAL